MPHLQLWICLALMTSAVVYYSSCFPHDLPKLCGEEVFQCAILSCTSFESVYTVRMASLQFLSTFLRPRHFHHLSVKHNFERFNSPSSAFPMLHPYVCHTIFVFPFQCLHLLLTILCLYSRPFLPAFA